MLKLEELKSGRFAILKHDHPVLHFDFLLEGSEAAATWRLSVRPYPGILVPAARINDHRLMYLDYEGPVSGNRGTVLQELSGTFEMLNSGAGKFSIRMQLAVDPSETDTLHMGSCFWIATLRWNTGVMEWGFETGSTSDCASAS
ncbi:MAG: hypothetical protein JNL58_05950 [Planctomyces sp.]|nr:hypothetical protein [Planctomyces sp.]